MEGEKKTARGAKLQLNRQAGLGSETVEVGLNKMRSKAKNSLRNVKFMCVRVLE